MGEPEKSFNWEILKDLSLSAKNIILSGGLNSDNVLDAVLKLSGRTQWI